jgi:hypothetical protein
VSRERTRGPLWDRSAERGQKQRDREWERQKRWKNESLFGKKETRFCSERQIDPRRGNRPMAETELNRGQAE